MSTRSSSSSTKRRALPALALVATFAAPAFAQQAPPPPPPPPGGKTMTIVTERRLTVGEDGQPLKPGTHVMQGPVVFIEHDAEVGGMTMVGPDGKRVRMIRNGPGPGMQGPGGPRGPERMMRMARELDLTPEQRKQVRGLTEAARPKMEELRSQIRVQRQTLREADPNARGYDALVAASSKRIGELTAQRVQQQAQLQRQVWQLLTPEQRAKAESRRAEAKKRRAEQADRMERRARELRGTP